MLIALLLLIHSVIIGHIETVFKISRGGFRTAVTSKTELFVVTVTGWKPVTIIIKCSILDVAAVLDPPLIPKLNDQVKHNKFVLFRNRNT